MILFIGKNPDFKAVFDANTQCYTVYKNNRVLVTKSKFVNVQSYLN